MFNRITEPGTIFFNFLAKDKDNAEDIVRVGNGRVVPGIAAADFESVDEAVAVVKEMKQVAPVVSIGLGGNGNIAMWKKALDIAARANPGHLNQPFKTAVYAKGFLDAKGVPQIVNALVTPSGKKGTVKLSNGAEIPVETFAVTAGELGIESVKFMPMNGLQHLEELVALTSALAKAGVKGIEPAGGIAADHVEPLYQALKNTGIQWIMPHIFGAAMDKETGRTRLDIVQNIVNQVV